MDGGEVAAWIGSVAAFGAAIFAGYQLVLFRKSSIEEEKAEIDGVAAMLWPSKRPTAVRSKESQAWKFEIVLDNPGHMPIREAAVDLSFPFEVCRIHYDGTVDLPSKDYRLFAGVLVSRSQREWTRTLIIPESSRDEIGGIQLTVSFVDHRGKPHRNPPDLANKSRFSPLKDWKSTVTRH